MSLSFEKTSILNKFCFPWWYYPCIATVKWSIAAMIVYIGHYLQNRVNDIQIQQPLLLSQKKSEKMFNIILKITNLPNDIIHQILSYINFESSINEFEKYNYSRLDCKVFEGYLMIYIIVSGPINIYCWYMAINHWNNEFKLEKDSWNRFELLMFDAITILPSYIPVNIVVHYTVFIIGKSEKVDIFSDDDDYTQCQHIYDCIVIWISVVFGLLQITPIMLAAVPAGLVLFLPGIFLVFPISLMACFCFCCIALQTEVFMKYKGFDKICGFIGVVFGVGAVMISYAGFTIILVTTVCIYEDNEWMECIEYGFNSEYCPKFNFDYNNFDSWIWIIKWAYF